MTEELMTGVCPGGDSSGHPRTGWCDTFPECRPVDPNYHFVDPGKPNHFHHDVLGDPATCTRDHNHPPKEDEPVAQLPPQCDCNMRSDHTLGCASGLAVGVKLDCETLKSPRASALDEARQLVTGDRNNQYGPPTQDFQRTANLLNALGYHREDATGEVHEILPSDVAIIIAQVKISRIMHSRPKRDSWVDLAGYAACGYECAEEENGHA